jgi:hypothetical protein
MSLFSLIKKNFFASSEKYLVSFVFELKNNLQRALTIVPIGIGTAAFFALSI